MPNRVKYRFVTTADPVTLRGIITLYRAHGWWDPADTPALLKRIIKGSHCFVIAERGGAVIGMARAISDGASDAYIQDVAVQPSQRGGGIGRALVRRLLGRLRRDKVRWTGLIAQDNSSPFYAGLGFKPLAKALPMLSKGSHV
jgi:spermidine synthase